MYPQELEEFRYSYGDMRPVLLKYIENNINKKQYHSVASSSKISKSFKYIPIYSCLNKKRNMIIPDNLKLVTTKPIIIIPVVVLSSTIL